MSQSVDPKNMDRNSQLNTDLLILGMSELNNLGEARNLRIEPDARVLWRDATSRLDGRSLHDKQTRTTSNNSANMRGCVPRLLETIEA